MNELENLKEELFCTRYESRIFAGYINYGKLERWIPGFSDFTTEDSHIKRYELAKEFIKGKQVLDIACGSGRGSYMLAEAGASKLTGVDLDTEAIRYATHRYQHQNITFLQGNAEQYVNEKKYDTIISFETIEHLNNVDTYLACIKKSLKDDGVFLVSTPIADVPHNISPKNTFHVQEWGFESFQDMLRQQFTIKNIFVQLYPKTDGRFKYVFKRILNKLQIGQYSILPRVSTISLYDAQQFNSQLFGKQIKGYQIVVCTKK